MLCIVGRGAVEHSVGVDQSGWRWTEPDSGCGQSHAAVSAGCGLATEPDQPGKGIGRRTSGYLLFLRRLDELQIIEELKATRLKKPIERRIFPEGDDPRGRPYADLRWSRFKNFEAREMYTVVSEHVFPFLRNLGGEDSTYSHHMKDARFTIPTPALLAKVVDLIDHVPM